MNGSRHREAAPGELTRLRALPTLPILAVPSSPMDASIARVFALPVAPGESGAAPAAAREIAA